jgi:hypothetical protein
VVNRLEQGKIHWDNAIAWLTAPSPSAELDVAGYALVREAGAKHGRDAEAARLGEALLARAGAPVDADLAFEVARCWARAGRANEAIAALARAVAAGFRNWEAVDRAREFASVLREQQCAARWSELRAAAALEPARTA